MYSLEGHSWFGLPLVFHALGARDSIGRQDCDLQLLKKLIRAGEDLNRPCPCCLPFPSRQTRVELPIGASPLWYAAGAYSYEATKLLLQHGALVSGEFSEEDPHRLAHVMKAKAQWIDAWFIRVKPLFQSRGDHACDLFCLPWELIQKLISEKIRLMHKATLE